MHCPITACAISTCRRVRRRSGRSSRPAAPAWRRSKPPRKEREKGMYDFTYVKPSSLPDAVKLLSSDPEAKALAGGMTYIPVLKQRLAKPSKVVDLAGL